MPIYIVTMRVNVPGPGRGDMLVVQDAVTAPTLEAAMALAKQAITITVTSAAEK